ncbi:MAG: hypothetical protein COA96_16225 [SAR86 cluster bacterium]|uniref:DUF4919 domain-containing protein n=1 Tax=SAR86 cluster bacterium TaxID=2030880 RepID=A0A2A5AJJ2_9GAMM|nr:MAG: hypothetical protein COA96_16225 [SAR86 cluster bacterium]
MSKKIAQFLCFIVAVITMQTSVNAQTTEIANFRTSLSSKTDFESIPTGRKLSYAFRALSISIYDLGLTDVEYDLINLAANGTPPRDRSFAEYTQACEFHESQTSQELPVNINYIAQVIANADQYEIEDKYSFLEEVFNKMSLRGKELVLEHIESLRDTNHLGTSRFNWIAVAQIDPDGLRSSFVRSCDNLSSNIESYEYEKTNPVGTLMPIRGEEVIYEDQ